MMSFRFTILGLVLLIFVGCAFTPVFHNTAEVELKMLSESLTNTRLEDLFRQHPTLRLVKSTEIGNGNIRHEFSYVAIEKEDVSQRPGYANEIYLYEKELTYSINIFVDASGVIYEVLEPVASNAVVKMSGERYDRWEKHSKPQRSSNVPVLH